MEKINPFRPGDIIPPGIFAGRGVELKQIERCILQTINGSPQNIMIIGERGIGKSSMALCTKYLAEGKIPTFDNKKFNLFTGSAIVRKGQSLIEVLVSLSSDIRKNLDATFGDKVKEIWGEISQIGIANIIQLSKSRSSVGFSTLTDDFCYSLEKLWDRVGKGDNPKGGLIIIIDEVDRISSFEGVASFFKSLIEKLTFDGYNKIMFLLSGMTEIKEKLYADHESIVRNFVTMKLETMPRKEAEQVIFKALKLLEDGNIYVNVDKRALDLIITLSDCYPHFLQELGYSSYEVDTDNNITEEDVKLGVLGTESYPGSIRRLGEQMFDRMYTKDVQSETYREILKIVAETKEEIIPRKVISLKFSKGQTILSTYLRELVKRGLLVNPERAMYGLPNKMFGVYIRLLDMQDKVK